jgi:hypothetical protein
MTLRPWVFAIAPLLAAATAHAQAPGDYYAGPSAAPVAPAPVVVNPCATPSFGIDPLAQRWAISLGFSTLTVAPEDAPDASADFSNTQVALRYRLSRRLELEAELSGGRQVLDDDEEGPLANGTFMIGARYRFMPERKWNWWLSGALGGTVIAHHQSDELEREAATRPVASLGVGIERRFRRLAIQAELKSLAIGPRKDQSERGDVPVAQPPMPTDPDGSPMDTPLPLPPAYESQPENLQGAAFSVNVSYYF